MKLAKSLQPTAHMPSFAAKADLAGKQNVIFDILDPVDSVCVCHQLSENIWFDRLTVVLR